jgi:hypothetical protein
MSWKYWTVNYFLNNLFLVMSSAEICNSFGKVKKQCIPIIIKTTIVFSQSGFDIWKNRYIKFTSKLRIRKFQKSVYKPTVYCNTIFKVLKNSYSQYTSILLRWLIPASLICYSQLLHHWEVEFPYSCKKRKGNKYFGSNKPQVWKIWP